MDNETCAIDFPPDLRERAEAAAREDAPDLERMSPEEVRNLVHELRIEREELQLRMDTLINVCEEQNRRVEDIRIFLENFTDAIARFDRGLHILYANPSFERITGISRQQAIGHSLAELEFQHGNIGVWESCIHQVFENNSEAVIEFEYGGAEGRRFFSAHAFPEQHDQGRLESVLVIAHEVTELVKTREKLRESEEQLNAFFGFTPARMTILDEDLRFVRVNKTSETVFGFSQENIVGKCFRDFVPDFAMVIEEDARKVLETGEPLLNHDVRGVSPVHPGETITWITSYFPLPLPGGKKGVGILAMDITARKRAEEELQKAREDLEEEVWRRTVDLEKTVVNLQEEITGRERAQAAIRENEKLLGTVLDTLPVGIMVLDHEGRIIRINPASQYIWGKTKYDEPFEFGKFKGWRVATGELITADQWAAARSLETGAIILDEEIEIEDFQGNRKIILNSAAPIRDESETIYGVIMVNEDITDRKKAELELQNYRDHLEELVNERTRELENANSQLKREIEERKQIERDLRASEEKFRIALKNAPINMIIQDRDRRHIWVYDARSALKIEDIYGKREEDIFPSEEAARLIEIKERVMATGAGERVELPLTPFGLQTFFLDITIEPLRDSRGELIGVASVNLNITERKRAEEALQEAKAYLEATLNALPDLMFEVDGGGTILNYHAQRQDRLYIPPEQFLGKKIRDVLPPSAAESIMKALGEAMESGLSRGTVYAMEMPERTEWFELSIASTGDPLNPETRYIALVRDITERKRAEEELRQSENRFRAAVDNFPGVFIVYDSERRIQFINRLGIERSGREPEEILGRPDEEVFPPRETQPYIPALDKAIETREPQTQEVRMFLPTGEYWALVNFIPLLTERGEIWQVLGISIDITERKQAEERLARNLKDLVFLSESATRFLEAMSSGELFRYTAQQLHSIGGRAVIAVSEYVPEGSRIIVQAVTGPADKLTKLGVLLGRDPAGQEFTLAEGTRERLTRGRLELVEGGLHDLTFNQLPQPLATRIERELEFGGIYVMPFCLGEDLMGTVSAATDRSEGLVNRELMEAVVNQAALALKRTRTEEALRESELRFRGAVENFPGMFKVYDPERRIRYINRQGAALSGNTPDEITGKRDEEYLPAEIADTFVPVLMRAIDMKQPQSMENHLKLPGGEKWFLANFIPLLNEQQQIWQILGTAVDITGRKKAEEKAARLNEHLHRQAVRLEAVNRELESFSYSISHDLRAPLRSLDGFSLALEEDYGERLDEQAFDYIHRIRAAAQRMARLIDDLLQLSRTTRAELKYTRVNLSEQAKSVLEELRNTEPERRVETVIQEGMSVEGDETLLRQVLQNLLGNSWKFTAYTEAPRIEFGEKREDGKRIFFVRDNGAGFDMKYADKLFIPFRRLHSDAEFSGTGIGLSIVKRVIDRHGGAIWAESEPGEGATFYFTLGE